MNLYQRLLGTPFVYNHVRPLAVGGIDMSPFYRRIEARSDSTVLDVGCGTGDALHYLDTFERYFGIDTDQVAIGFAENEFGKRANVEFACRLCDEQDVQRLWPGTWLALGETPGLRHVTHLATLLTTGSLTVRTLSLEQSEANRTMLAEELAGEYVRKFDKLAVRLALPKPKTEEIERAYMQLTEQIRQSEQLLGVQIPCLAEQIAFECALAAVDC